MKKEIIIDGEKYIPAKEAKQVGRSTKAFKVGDEIFVRTVTYHYTGRVVDVTDGFVFLEDCAWIADSGRFTEFMGGGNPSEAEIYGDREVGVNIASIVDFSKRKLVTEQI